MLAGNSCEELPEETVNILLKSNTKFTCNKIHTAINVAIPQLEKHKIAYLFYLNGF